MEITDFADAADYDLGYDDDTADLLFNSIRSDSVRSLVLATFLECDMPPGGEAVTGYEIIKVMTRIVNVAFVVAFCRWKQLRDTAGWGRDEDLAYFKNSRFSKLFQNVLINESVTFDGQILALIELWVSLCNSNTPKYVRENFSMIFDGTIKGEAIGITLQAVRKAVKTVSFKSSKTSGGDFKKSLNELCYRLLSSLVIFRALDIKFPDGADCSNDKDICFSYSLPTMERIKLYPNKTFDDGKFIVTERQLRALSEKPDERVDVLRLYMRVETSMFDGKLQNEYRSFDGEKEMRIRTDCAVKRDDLPDDIKADLRETRKFLAFNYKNVRGLAAVVYDTIQNMRDIKRKLFDLCKTKYPQIIADVPGADAPGIYWDNIITLLLVEMGISDFLEYIFVDDYIFNLVLENIGWRYIGYSNIKKCKDIYKAECARLEKSSPNPEISAQQVLELRVNTVLRAMSVEKESGAPIHPYEESLTYKYENICAHLDKLENGGPNMPIADFLSATAGLADVFKNMFTFLQVFYTGLDAYAAKKIDLESKKFDKGKRENSVDPLEGECMQEFYARGREKYAEVKNQTVKQAYEAFCEMCRQYNSGTADNLFSVSEQARRLKYVVTRNYICDVGRLEYFVRIEDKGITIFDLLLPNSVEYLSDPNYHAWLSQFKDLFMFLIYNEDYTYRGQFNDESALRDKTCDPIYPYIVTYYKENVDRDNLKKCIYRVPIPTGGGKLRKDGYVVTLLMETEYPANTYYCIPLRYGSSESWWINPVLIPKSAVRELTGSNEQ